MEVTMLSRLAILLLAALPALAQSTGSIARPNGWARSMLAWAASLVDRPGMKLVGIPAGQTELTRIPSRATSIASQ